MPVKSKASDKPLTSVMEDYLEAIFDLDREKKVVRVRDIAQRMDVKMPTVSSMLKTLRDRGMVHYEKHEYVELTPGGSKVGKEMNRRHVILKQFLTEILKIKNGIAEKEACQMEHALSAGTLDSLVDFMAFIQSCPRAGESWLQHFEDYRKHGYRPDVCELRSQEFATEIKRKAAAPKMKKTAATKKRKTAKKRT